MDTQVLGAQTSGAQALDLDALERLRQQFDQVPYPRIPLEISPKHEYNDLFIHNLTTSYYLKHRQVVSPTGKLILDAGCGSGFKSLILAEANPGATIIGVDLSESSVQLARERLKFHGFTNVEFHAMLIEDLPQLGLEFDYINCDETLYLLPNPIAGLQALKAVLKPNGIIRGNLHNAYQRAHYFRSQALFRMMGVMGEAQDLAQAQVAATMESLKPHVRLRRESWKSEWGTPEKGLQVLFANHLLNNDKGFTIPDLFEMLAQTDLEFVSMVEWRHWDVTDLFENLETLPELWDVGLAFASTEEKLRMYELLHPVHRLMDFWCSHADQANGLAADEWSNEQWRSAIAHLHPQLQTEEIWNEMVESVQQSRPFDISAHLSLPALTPILIDPAITSCLMLLWQQPQPMMALVEHYCRIKPLDLVTPDPLDLDLVSPDPLDEAIAFQEIQRSLNRLDAFLYVLLEQ
jgi:2-polyprenyl-3-methyl-5-hydroxy-6-metoxy-1,4-benzoquinol methylase